MSDRYVAAGTPAPTATGPTVRRQPIHRSYPGPDAATESSQPVFGALLPCLDRTSKSGSGRTATPDRTGVISSRPRARCKGPVSAAAQATSSTATSFAHPIPDRNVSHCAHHSRSKLQSLRSRAARPGSGSGQRSPLSRFSRSRSHASASSSSWQAFSCGGITSLAAKSL